MDTPSDLTELPDGLTARSMTLADVDIVTELVAACELHHDGVVEIDREDIEVDWARPALRPRDRERRRVRRRPLGGRGRGLQRQAGRDQRASGFAGSRNRHHAAGLDRGSRRATGLDEGVADHDGRQPAAAAILEGHGYGYGHTSWILEIEHDARPDDPALPAGIGFRDYEPERDAHETYRVIEDAFNEWPNRDPATFEDWAALTIERPSFAPWQMILATDERTGDIVGVSFMLDYEAEGGWVQQVATRASHRHQGIARAMLIRAFQVFWDQGERVVGSTPIHERARWGCTRRSGCT